ncbi:MAG: S16 family serine protease, partial [Duodenibacillus sp.]
VALADDAVRDIIRYYTREAGVRGLERSISKIFRKVVRIQCEAEDAAAKKAEAAKAEDGKPVRARRTRKINVTAKNLSDFLGVRKYMYGVAQKDAQVGQVNGLARTEVGGDILTVEAVVFPGKGAVQRTGSLGDVMKESVEAARSVVRARAQRLGIDPAKFASTDWHVHFPEGATPKDGPSAGAAITTAMVSAMTGIAVRHDVAMTGEITLRGEVLEIGGLKEKLLAALRGGIKKVLIPETNVKDLAEIPDCVKSGMEIVPVRWIDQVLEEALVSVPKPVEAVSASVVAAQKAALEKSIPASEARQ